MCGKNISTIVQVTGNSIETPPPPPPKVMTIKLLQNKRSITIESLSGTFNRVNEISDSNLDTFGFL